MNWPLWRQVEHPFVREPMATVEYECFHCCKRTVIPAKRIADAEANYWRERYAKLIGQLNDAVEYCNKTYGGNPMRDWFMDELIKMRDEPGEEWKKGKYP